MRFAPELVAEQPELGAGRFDPKDQPAAFGVADIPLLRPGTEALHATFLSLVSPASMDTLWALLSATSCMVVQRNAMANMCPNPLRHRVSRTLSFAIGCRPSRY